MRKGEQTRSAIVAAALELAARDGLEGLTIGALAERMTMSKSGVFAHFGSREELQINVLKEYERRFVDEVLRPSLASPRGLPRLQQILQLWIERTAIEATRGCIWVSSATEYDDRPGAVRDELVAMVGRWKRELGRAIQQAIEAGALAAGTDPGELIFELYGVMLALHHDTRLLRSPDALARAQRLLERLLKHYQPPQTTASKQMKSARRSSGRLARAKTEAP
jgi:AcrR family transcriptional regulator